MSLDSLRTQTATYWAPGTPDGYGSRSWAAPVEVMCRWQDRSDRDIDDRGVEFTTRAVVYPDAELELHGMLYRGETTETDPMSLDGAWTIRSLRRSDNPPGSTVVYKALLGGAS